MIIKGLSRFKEDPNSWETIIRAICLNRVVDIKDIVDLEFESDFEPEIKLKAIYMALCNEKENNIEAKRFVECLYGILKRIDSKNENYLIIYHIILALEIIKPNDVNHILRDFIEKRKFVNLTVEDDFNLHIRLIDIYQSIISDEESIRFLENYLLAEFRRDKLFDYPNFFSTSLRFFIKFRSSKSYFNVFELLLSKLTLERKDAKFRLIISLDEYCRTKNSFDDLFLWLNECSQDIINSSISEDQKGKTIDFMSDIIEWLNRKKLVNKDNSIDLMMMVDIILGKAEFIKNGCRDFTVSLPSLTSFGNLYTKNSLLADTYSKFFVLFLDIFKQKGFYCNIPVYEDFDSSGEYYYITISNSKKEKFIKRDAPKYIEVSEDLYMELTKKMPVHFGLAA